MFSTYIIPKLKLIISSIGLKASRVVWGYKYTKPVSCSSFFFLSFSLKEQKGLGDIEKKQTKSERLATVAEFAKYVTKLVERWRFALGWMRKKQNKKKPNSKRQNADGSKRHIFVPFEYATCMSISANSEYFSSFTFCVCRTQKRKEFRRENKS